MQTINRVGYAPLFGAAHQETEGENCSRDERRSRPHRYGSPTSNPHVFDRTLIRATIEYTTHAHQDRENR